MCDYSISNLAICQRLFKVCTVAIYNMHMYLCDIVNVHTIAYYA